MRICVTGGTGFIGKMLVRRLLAEDHQVRVLARSSPRAEGLKAQGAEIVPGDVSDDAALDSAAKDAELVFHAAAKVAGSGSLEEFTDVNVNGTQRVFDACLRQRVRQVVYLSSVAVYGIVKEDKAIDESTPFDGNPEGRDFYSRSKIAADQLVISYSKKHDLPTAILRPGIVFGPGKPLPVALLGGRLGQTNIVFGSPNHRFPLNYVENLVDALLLSMTPSGDLLRQYIVLDDDDLTLGQYHSAKSDADLTRTVFLPGWLVLLGGPLGGIPRHQVQRALQDRHYSTRLIREDLGWSPRIGLKEAIGRTQRR